MNIIFNRLHVSEKDYLGVYPQCQYLGNYQVSAASLMVSGLISVKQIKAKQIAECGAHLLHSCMS